MTSSAFQPTVLTVPSTGGGTGQGELNIVTNSIAAADTTGWTGAGRSTGGGPLSPTISTYFTVTAGNSGEGALSGAYASLTLPSSLQNKKLKVEFYFTSSTDVYYVSVRKGGVRVPLSTDNSSNVTALPTSTTGKFVAYFDTDNSGSWTVHLTRVTGSGSSLQFTNVVVGPGIQPQGAVVGSDVLWTNPTTAGFGTLVSPNLYYQRVGTKLKIQGYWTNGTVAASLATLTLPSNLTIDGSLIPSGATQVVGYWQHSNSSATTPKRGTILASGTGTTVRFGIDDYTNSQSPLTQQNASAITGTGLAFEVNFEVPIAEWAGSGTVQLAQNDVEYASNTGSAGTAANTDYTTGAAYGPGGSNFVAVSTSTTATTATRYAVSFQTPIQSGDSLVFEYNPSPSTSNTWVSAFNQSMLGLTQQGNTIIGAGIQSRDSTSVWVAFGNAGRTTSGTYGTAAGGWTDLSTWKWRVRKSSAGAAVGFGLATDTSLGLVRYSEGSYVPALSATGWSFSGVGATYLRVGDKVTVWGYADASGTRTGALTISLPITPSPFGAGVNARQQASGSLNTDSSSHGIVGTSSGTTVEQSGGATLPTGATGLRFHFSYRI